LFLLSNGLDSSCFLCYFNMTLYLPLGKLIERRGCTKFTGDSGSQISKQDLHKPKYFINIHKLIPKHKVSRAEMKAKYNYEMFSTIRSAIVVSVCHQPWLGYIEEIRIGRYPLNY
jgi:hypothetical protein